MLDDSEEDDHEPARHPPGQSAIPAACRPPARPGAAPPPVLTAAAFSPASSFLQRAHPASHILHARIGLLLAHAHAVVSDRHRRRPVFVLHFKPPFSSSAARRRLGVRGLLGVWLGARGARACSGSSRVPTIAAATAEAAARRAQRQRRCRVGLRCVHVPKLSWGFCLRDVRWWATRGLRQPCCCCCCRPDDGDRSSSSSAATCRPACSSSRHNGGGAPRAGRRICSGLRLPAAGGRGAGAAGSGGRCVAGTAGCSGGSPAVPCGRLWAAHHASRPAGAAGGGARQQGGRRCVWSKWGTRCCALDTSLCTLSHSFCAG